MFTLPDLPFSYNALEPFIDEETMRLHHDGHHATYIKNLNEALIGYEDLAELGVEELLKSLDQVPEKIRTQVKNNAGGHYHHSLFWTMIGPGKGGQPKGKLLESIKKQFGSFDVFKEKFNQSATAVFGSGWTWVIWDKDKLQITNTPNQDSPVSLGQVPLIVIDLWEHAYYLKYKNKRADFISAWWQIVNWDEAEMRLG